MKDKLAKIILWVLNNPLRTTPCEYALVNGLEVFSEDFLRNEVRLNPTITVQEFLTMTTKFKECEKSKNGVSVFQDGTCREATEKEIQEITNL